MRYCGGGCFFEGLWFFNGNIFFFCLGFFNDIVCGLLGALWNIFTEILLSSGFIINLHGLAPHAHAHSGMGTALKFEEKTWNHLPSWAQACGQAQAGSSQPEYRVLVGQAHLQLWRCKSMCYSTGNPIPPAPWVWDGQLASKCVLDAVVWEYLHCAIGWMNASGLHPEKWISFCTKATTSSKYIKETLWYVIL